MINIDLKILKEQIRDLATAQATLIRVDSPDRVVESLEGVLNMLGAIRDQIDPPEVPYKVEPVTPPPPRDMSDRLAVAICEGFEDPEDDTELVRAWQWLIDSRIAYLIQGSFGRIANRMIQEGLCTSPPEKSSIIKPFKNFF